MRSQKESRKALGTATLSSQRQKTSAFPDVTSTRPGRSVTPNAPTRASLSASSTSHPMSRETGTPGERAATILLPNSVAQPGMKRHMKAQRACKIPTKQGFRGSARIQQNARERISRPVPSTARPPIRLRSIRTSVQPVQGHSGSIGFAFLHASDAAGRRCDRLSLHMRSSDATARRHRFSALIGTL